MPFQQVVIMLVIDRENDRALLSRQSRFVPRMWSCLAGFIEVSILVGFRIVSSLLEILVKWGTFPHYLGFSKKLGICYLDWGTSFCLSWSSSYFLSRSNIYLTYTFVIFCQLTKFINFLTRIFISLSLFIAPSQEKAWKKQWGEKHGRRLVLKWEKLSTIVLSHGLVLFFAPCFIVFLFQFLFFKFLYCSNSL